jgi:lipopolysaccharide biosynthesis glycosyltransferase
MLIDLPRWKAARVSERAQAVLDEHNDRCVNVDQDALNIVGIGNWSVLPPRWNHQVVGRTVWSPQPAAGETVAITHFINEKPWNPETLCVGQATFDAALRESGWMAPQDYRRHRLHKNVTAAKTWLDETRSVRFARRVKRGVMRRARRVLAARPSSDANST